MILLIDNIKKMMKPALLSILFLYAMISLQGCQPAIYQRTDYVFGTLVEITIYDSEDAAPAAQAVIDDLRHLESLLHAFKNSQLSTLNQHITEGKTEIPVSSELAQFLQSAQEDSLPISNWFNPAIGKLIALWGFHKDDYPAEIPNQQAINALLKANPKMNDFTIKNNIIYVHNHTLAIDLGGYAKGIALDRAAAILKKLNIHNALINIGGNVLALGQKGERHWTVGIRDPKENRAFAVASLYDGEAIGTSGDYQRFFVANGQSYHHIIDPKTGYPAKMVKAVTIIVNEPSNSGRYSDMFSKPFFIAGIDDFSTVCKHIPVSMIAFIDHNNQLYLSQKMKERMTLINNQRVTHSLPNCFFKN